MTGWATLLAEAGRVQARFRDACRRPREAQSDLLKSIIAANAGTRFGIRHGFGEIASLSDFRLAVPPGSYERHAPWIARCEAGEPNVLTAEPVLAFEETAGSTGASKLVPYTASAMRAFRDAVLPWLADLAQRRPAAACGSVYVTVSPPPDRRRQTRAGLPVGLGSEAAYLGPDVEQALLGLLVLPAAAQRGETIADWQIATAAALVRAADLSFISVWSPTFLTRLIEVIEVDRAAILRGLCHDSAASRRLSRAGEGGRLDPTLLWPQLDTVSCWADGPSALHARRLAERIPGVFLQPKGLLATEGAITLAYGDEQGGVPALLSTFLEFVDDGGSVHLVDELCAGEEYHVLMTTPGGLYRYDIGDRVRCVGHRGEVPRLAFAGRDGLVSDLVGEKLSEAFVSTALGRLASPALLCAQAWPKPHYEVWIDGPAEPVETVEDVLRTNPQYRYARDLGQLGAIRPLSRPEFQRRLHDDLVRRGMRLGELKPAALLPWSANRRHATDGGWLG